MYTMKYNHGFDNDSRSEGSPRSPTAVSQSAKILKNESMNQRKYKIQICRDLSKVQILANRAGYGRLAILFEELQFALASPSDAKGLANLLAEKGGSV